MSTEDFERLTGVILQSLLDFNERRLVRIAGHAIGDEDYRAFVQGRIESLKEQIEQAEQASK